MLQRVDEAVAVIEGAEDHALPGLADQLWEHSHTERAREIVRARATTSQDRRLLEWLQRRAKETGDFGDALSLAERLFWASPSMHLVEGLQALAQQQGRWNELCAEIVERLTTHGYNNLLTQFHLSQGNVDLALQTVDLPTQRAWGWTQTVDTSLMTRVAQAAEAHYPHDAIRLYMNMVRRLIEQQGRQNYATAADYLKRVRDIYHHIDEEATWQTLITDMRTEHKRRPAMRQELDLAGI